MRGVALRVVAEHEEGLLALWIREGPLDFLKDAFGDRLYALATRHRCDIDVPREKFLREALTGVAPLTIVAPDRNRSGASHSLTLEVPLRVQQAEPDVWYVINGTPTDCVHLAVTGVLDFLPDMVVSGINLGANMGDDTIYSGTVAAATEGYLLGIPSLAVSLASKSGRHFETAAAVALQLVERFRRAPVAEPVLLNVNVPSVAPQALGALEVTRLGKRHKAEPVMKVETPRGETAYWIGAAGSAEDAGPGTDFYAVAEGRVSVTPLQVDLTFRGQLDLVREWLGR